MKVNTCVDTLRSSSCVLQLYKADVAEPTHNEGHLHKFKNLLGVAFVAFSHYFSNEPPGARSQHVNELASITEAGGVINLGE